MVFVPVFCYILYKQWYVNVKINSRNWFSEFISSLGNDADDYHICKLVSRHLWAIGRNLDLYDGPPPLEVN